MQQCINLNTINNVQSDRPTNTVVQGDTHVPWQLSSWVSHWECVWTQRDTPLCRDSATGSQSTHAQECQECIVRSGDYTWNPTDSRACADSPSDARESRRGFTWRVAWGILFRTGSKQNMISVMTPTHTYEPHISSYLYEFAIYLNLT